MMAQINRRQLMRWSGLRCMTISLVWGSLAWGTLEPGLAQVEAPNPNQARQNQSLNELVELLKQDEPPLGSRSAICAVSPGLVGNTDTIWSDRPLFLWQGSASSITLRDLASGTIIWSTDLSPLTQQVAFPAAVLQPGRIYSWELAAAGQPSLTFSFEVMGAERRELIAAALERLETHLKDLGGSNEAIALQQARYFADLGLWPDALQILHSVAEPSAALEQSTQDILTYLCGGAAQLPNL